MLFDTVEALKAYLVNLNEFYEPYAAGLWMLGIKSTVVMANSRKEDLAGCLAYPEQPSPAHQVHASDIIVRSQSAGTDPWSCLYLD